MRVLIRQAKLADPRSPYFNQVMDLYLESGMIREMAPQLEKEADQEIQAPGLIVFPGWVDGFADYADPGYEHRETLETGLKAARRGGFCRVVTLANTLPRISRRSQLEYLQKKAAGGPVILHPLGTITQDAEGRALSEMLDLHAGGAIGFSDGWTPVQSPALMVKALEYVRAFDGLLIQLPLDQELASGGLMHEGEWSTYLGMPGIPELAESLIIHRDLELLAYADSRLHITGLSTESGLNLVRQAKDRGLKISCSVTPYHLLFTDESLNQYNSLYKVDPPLRTEKDRQALIRGLADGTIDAIASHHRPQDEDAKQVEFGFAASGMNAQEMMVSVLWDRLSPNLDLRRWTSLLSLSWREILGLEPALIEKDQRAEITLFSGEQPSRFPREGIRSLSRNNPFMEEEYRGKVLGLINGEILYLNPE